MTLRIFHIALSLFVLLNINAIGQDIHFSQFYQSPLNLNPALSGDFEGDLRLVGNHKSQWTSFANAYSTFAASCDYGCKNPIKKYGRFGLGFQFNTDIAGDANFSTNHFKGFIAYHLPLLDSTLRISVGANAAWNQHGIDISLLRFGNQYDGEVYNSNIPSNELIIYDEFNYFDYSAGIGITWAPNLDLTINTGVSINHINSPQKSFFDERNISLPIKYLYHGKMLWHVKDDFWLEPLFMIMHQEKYLEVNIGSMIRIEYNPLGLKYLFAGAILRARDAGIFMIGGNYHDITIALSYDINLSKLTSISRGRGGIELSIIYILNKPKPFKAPYYRKCPEFL